MLYDNLSDYLIECEPDPEHTSRIEADRVTAEWRCPLQATAPQRSLESLPLFATGKEEQRGLFE